MKFTVVTQWVKVPPVQSLANRTVVNPAGKPSNGSPEPGGVRVQAAELSPEMSIVVDTRITPQPQGKGTNADAVSGAEGRSPRRVRASAEDTTEVAERGMHSEGEPGNLGEPHVSLSEDAGRAGVPADQEPRRWWIASDRQRAGNGTQSEGADKVLGSEREAKRPKTDGGQS